MKKFIIFGIFLASIIGNSVFAGANDGILSITSTRQGEIGGESKIRNYEGKIDIIGFSHSMGDIKYNSPVAQKFVRTNPEASFIMPTNKAVPKLIELASKGEQFSEFKYSVLRASGSGSIMEPITYIFNNVHITSVNSDQANDDSVITTVKIIYQTMTIQYKPQNAKGELGAPIVGIDNTTAAP